MVASCHLLLILGEGRTHHHMGVVDTLKQFMNMLKEVMIYVI